MGLEIGIALFEKVFFYTAFLSQYWISQIIIVVATMAMITRKTSDWKTLALPVMAGWQIFGMRLPWAFYAIAGMLFVLDTLSLKAVEGAIGAVSDSLGLKQGVLTKGGREYRRLRRVEGRMNVKNELQRLKDVEAPETKRRRDIIKESEDRLLKKSINKEYFPSLYEEDELKKKKSSSKPKEMYLE